jgi:hypothetical protein
MPFSWGMSMQYYGIYKTVTSFFCPTLAFLAIFPQMAQKHTSVHRDDSTIRYTPESNPSARSSFPYS